MAAFCTHCWRSHRQDMHGIGTLMGCPTCRVTFCSRSAFRRHRKDPVSQCRPGAVTDLRCHDCGQELPTARKLYFHLAAEHSNFKEPPPATRTTMETFCAHCWRSHREGMHGIGTQMGCPICRVTFYSRAAFKRHRGNPISQCRPGAITEFRCCDCDQEFPTSGSLYIHLAAEHPNFREPPPARTRGIHYCDECDRSFVTKKALQSHRAGSRIHNPLLEKKVGCIGCKRKFDAPSSLLAHLESGSCKSGITRDGLDNTVIAHDRENIITDPDAVLARLTGNLSLTGSDVSSICDGSRFDTPDDSSDAGSIYAQSEAFDGRSRCHTTGGVSLTPDASSTGVSSSSDGSGVYTPGGDSTGTATPTAGTGDSGGMSASSPPFPTMSFSVDGLHTPSASPTASNQPAAEPTLEQLRSWLLPDGTFECPICPAIGRLSFPTFAELQAHMQSPTAHPQLNFHAFSPDPHDPPTSTASSESGISTPSTAPAHPYLLPSGKYRCPLCPFGSGRPFKSLVALQRHILSPIAHMPKIYRCPDPEFLGITLNAGAEGRMQKKSFTKFSALVRHVEDGACPGGRLMFKAMVGLVNEKLTDMGMGDMKMIPAE